MQGERVDICRRGLKERTNSTEATNSRCHCFAEGYVLSVKLYGRNLSDVAPLDRDITNVVRG